MAKLDYHPLFEARLDAWRMLRHSYEGQACIKDKTVTYLPPTPGQVLDGMAPGTLDITSPGYLSYQNYLLRAVYPDFFREGVNTLVGILNEKPAKVSVPKGMEYLIKSCTPNQEDIQTLLRKIHTEQLTAGRLGLFADMEEEVPQTQPNFYITTYNAENVPNWDAGAGTEHVDKLNYVILDESGYTRSGGSFQWEYKEQYRVLALGSLFSLGEEASYRYAVTDDATNPRNLSFSVPVYRGEEAKEIPFVFVGSKDMDPSPDLPPLLGLAEICLAIYRAEADYRYALFMQAQDTLVVVGGIRASNADVGQPLRVGADARIDVELGGDAKYIGIHSEGIPEMRKSIEADRAVAAVRTGQLLAPGKMSMESGEALKTRVASQTATLTTVANAAAAALEAILKKIARWKGLDESKVAVSPNLEFSNFQLATQDLVQLITAKKLGFPISFETMHNISRERGLTRSTWKEEQEQIQADPDFLVEVLRMDDGPLNGNNPLQGAGGPKKKPLETHTTGNKPKE